MKDRGVVLLSGGLDSAILCAFLQRAEQDEVLPLFINRNQRALEAERAAASTVVKQLKIQTPIVEIAVGLDVYRPFITQAERDAKGIPGRNLVHLALAAPYAYLAPASYIAIGANSSDNFPDSDKAFFSKFSAALNASMNTEIAVMAPFADHGMKKSDVIAYGFKEGLQDLIWQTLSCYSPRGDLHCGKCSGCRVRRQAFEVAEIADETHYAEAE